jgi:hypothetical protein
VLAWDSCPASTCVTQPPVCCHVLCLLQCLLQGAVHLGASMMGQFSLESGLMNKQRCITHLPTCNLACISCAAPPAKCCACLANARQLHNQQHATQGLTCRLPCPLQLAAPPAGFCAPCRLPKSEIVFSTAVQPSGPHRQAPMSSATCRISCNSYPFLMLSIGTTNSIEPEKRLDGSHL